MGTNEKLILYVLFAGMMHEEYLRSPDAWHAVSLVLAALILLLVLVDTHVSRK